MLHIACKYNFADILTKHWDHQGTYYKLIQPVFHHEGNTAALFLDNTIEVDTSINDLESGIIVFSILGSDKALCKPQNGTRVCGQTIVQE